MYRFKPLLAALAFLLLGKHSFSQDSTSGVFTQKPLKAAAKTPSPLQSKSEKGSLPHISTLSLPILPQPKEFHQALTKRVFDSLASLKSGLSKLETIYKHPIKFHGATVSYSGLTDSSYVHPGASYYWSTLQFHSQWEIVGIPLQINYQNLQWSDVHNMEPFAASVKFDRENYLNQLQKELRSKINFDHFEKNVTEPLALLKQQAEQELRTELNALNEKYGMQLNRKISELGELQSLFTRDLVGLRAVVLSQEHVRSLAALQQSYTELQNKINLGEPVDREQLKVLADALQQSKGVEELLQSVEAHQKRWTQSGLLAKMKEWDLLKKQQLTAFVNDPATITRLARQTLSLSSLQRLFLKVNRLSGGQNTMTASPLSMNHFLNNGLLSEFVDNDKTLLLLWGKQPRVPSIHELPFASNVMAAGAKAGRFVRQNAQGAQTSMSIMSFDQGLMEFLGGAHAPSAFRRSIVSTLSKEFVLGTRSKVTTEISRSVSSYNGAHATEGKKQLEELFSANDLLLNTAFRVDYVDEYPGAALSYEVHAARVANGYSNPGSMFLNQGSSEVGLKLRKSFLEKKIQLSLRTDVKEYQYQVEGDRKWRSTYGALDVRWRMKKGQFLALRYLPSKMILVTPSGKATLSSFDRVSADAAA